MSGSHFAVLGFIALVGVVTIAQLRILILIARIDKKKRPPGSATFDNIVIAHSGHSSQLFSGQRQRCWVSSRQLRETLIPHLRKPAKHLRSRAVTPQRRSRRVWTPCSVLFGVTSNHRATRDQNLMPRDSSFGAKKHFSRTHGSFCTRFGFIALSEN